MKTHETNTVPRHRLRSTLLAGSCLIAACIDTAQSPEPGAPLDSPSALIQRLSRAESSRSYADLLREIPPNDREAAVYIVWYGVAYDAIGAEPRVAREYQDILDEFRLDEEWLNRDATGPEGLRRVAADTLAGQPLGELFAELTAFKERHGRFGARLGFSDTIHGLDVEDDRATALIGESRFTFVKLEGTWYWRFLDFDSAAGDA